MTRTSIDIARVPSQAPERRLDSAVRAHPMRAYIIAAYAFSWAWWALAYAGLGMAAVVLGGFGPAVAAWFVTSKLGTTHTWARSILRWRVPARHWAYALGIPAAIWAVMNLALWVLGEPVDAGKLVDRFPAYVGTFVFVALLGGGQEEPGWRGFALPWLQERHSPVRATLLLALIWGLWHLPLYGLGFIGPMLYAFAYTPLYNRTRSVLLCVVLHGSFTAALDHLILTADSAAVDAVIGLTLLAFTGLTIALTRGRLGTPPRAA